MSADSAALGGAILRDQPGRSAVAVETFRYDNHIVRAFAIATAIWGLVGTSAGLLIACQLFWPQLNLNTPFTTFGRLRPLHTNAVIFAFVGNGMFCGIYYSLQRLCKAADVQRCPELAEFLGLAGDHYQRGDHAAARPDSSKEYAELEWPIDIAIAVIWVAFTINLLGTVHQAAREAHVCLHLVLHRDGHYGGLAAHRQLVGNSRRPFKSYSVYAGRAGCAGSMVVWP